MTTEHEASRTLVKSPPELWAECSDAGSLARHLGEFGEITITRLEPETTVAWEGEHVSGTVRIEPSGWGTRVTLTAQARLEVMETEPQPDAVDPEAQPVEGSAEIVEPPPEMAQPPAEMPTVEAIDEEEINATVEETPEEPDPALATDTGPFRIRWRRMTRRMRGLFQTGELQEEPTSDAAELAGGAEPIPSTPHEEPEVMSVPEPEPQPEARIEAGEESGPSLESDPSPESELDLNADPDPDPDPDPDSNPDPEVILTAALDSLGQAHHRPFSRA